MWFGPCRRSRRQKYSPSTARRKRLAFACPWNSWFEPGPSFSSTRIGKDRTLGIPLRQIARVGAYIVLQHLAGRKRYPLVLMLEPLFRCNLACAGCGKIDYPDAILNKRISVEDALASVDECGAPVVVMAGGEPLLHKDLPKIVEGVIARKKFAIVCTNALLLEKKIDQYRPDP